MKKRTLSLILASVMVLGLTACGGQTTSSSGSSGSSGSASSSSAAPAEESVTIKLGYTHGTSNPQESDEVMYAQTFKEYVEANSDTITVELYPGSTLGSQADTVGAVSAGTTEMTIQNCSQLNNYDPSTMIFSLPGAFRDIEETNQVLDSEWAMDLMDQSREVTGIRVLGQSCTGMRCFTVSDHELRTVDDIAGLTFRVPESPIYNVILQALSANPVPMPSSEMYVAMQNHVVDGQENPIQNIVIDKSYEVQDWCVLDNHTPTVMSYMINDDFYNSLSDNQKEVINAAHEEAMAAAREVTQALEASGIETLEANGMTVYEPTAEELKAWQDTYAGACEEYMREQIGDELVDQCIAQLNEIRGEVA